MRADHELHQRTEAPNGGGAQDVQSREGRFEAVGETGVSLVAADGTSKFGSEKIVLGNIHAISGSQENVVEVSLTSVIEAHFDARAIRCGGRYCASKVHWHVLWSLHHPSRASRPDRSRPALVLYRKRETP